MSEGKYAAVWWAKEKKWSVVEASTIVEGDKEPGCYAYALWNHVPYEVKILRISDDFKMLSNLKVNSEGAVQIEKALQPSVSQPSKALKETKRKDARKEKAAALTPVFLTKAFSDEEEVDNPDQDLDDLNNENRSTGESNKTSPLKPVYGVPNKESPSQLPRTSANNGMSWPQPPKDVVNYLYEVAHLLKKGKGNQLSKDELDSTKGTNQVDKSSIGNKIARQSRAAETSLPNCSRKRSPAPSSRLPKETLTSVATLNSPSGSGLELPFPTPEIADPCLLIPGFNVYVSKKRKNRIVKYYKSKPDVMIRELLLHMLGEDNLKGMRARNHGSKSQYMPIPPHIMDATETFVANYASSTLEKSKVTKCVNNFLQKLRDPSRDHHKSENLGRKKQDNKSDSESSEEEGTSFETSSIIRVATGPSPRKSAKKSPWKVAPITPSAPLNSNHVPASSPWKVNGVGGLTNDVSTATRVLEFSSPPPAATPQPPAANPQPPAANNQPQNLWNEQSYNHWQAAPFQPQTFGAYSVPGAAFGYHTQHHQHYAGTEPGHNLDSHAFPTYPMSPPTYQSLGEESSRASHREGSGRSDVVGLRGILRIVYECETDSREPGRPARCEALEGTNVVQKVVDFKCNGKCKTSVKLQEELCSLRSELHELQTQLFEKDEKLQIAIEQMRLAEVARKAVEDNFNKEIQELRAVREEIQKLPDNFNRKDCFLKQAEDLTDSNDCEVPPGQVHVGNNVFIKKKDIADIELDHHKFTLRVAELCKLFWKDVHLMVLKGTGEDSNLRRIPDIHLKSMRDILNGMKWKKNGIPKKRGKRTTGEEDTGNTKNEEDQGESSDSDTEVSFHVTEVMVRNQVRKVTYDSRTKTVNKGATRNKAKKGQSGGKVDSASGVKTKEVVDSGKHPLAVHEELEKPSNQELEDERASNHEEEGGEASDEERKNSQVSDVEQGVSDEIVFDIRTDEPQSELDKYSSELDLSF